jgi:hypothetical protein
MKLLSLCLMAAGAYGAVTQLCAGFEDSKKPRELIVKARSDSSVLLYQITDVGSSNIPCDINDEILQLEPNGFGICTQEKSSKGLCDTVGTFSLKFDGAHQDLVNKFVQAGEKVNLTISEEGLYCALMYQEGAELSYIELIEKHSYGRLPLPQYGTMNVLFHLSRLLVMTCVVLGVMFLIERRAYMRAIYQDISFLLMFKLIFCTNKYVVFRENNFGGSHGYVGSYEDFPSLYDALMSLTDFSSLFDALFCVQLFTSCYKLSVGVFGFQKKKTDKTTMQPFFKTCFLLMVFSDILVSFQQPLDLLIPLQLFRFICIFSQIILSTVRISMVYILWKKSKITQIEIADPVFAKKYYLSKVCLLWVPIVISLVSFAGVRVFMSAISMDAYSHSGDFGNDMQKISFLSMKSSINQNYLFVLLKNLPEFSMLFVFWALLLIWRPSLTQKTDLESIHSNEIVEEIEDEKL